MGHKEAIMSHVSESKTVIKNLTILKETLKQLGYSYYEGQAIQGKFLGAGKKVDLVVEKSGTREFGFYKDSDGTYGLKGDFGTVQAGKDKADEISQFYTVNKVRFELKRMGAASISQINLENEGEGAVKLVANLA